MERTLFTSEHDLFRQNFRRFLEKEVVPRYEEFEDAGMVPRDVWKKSGESAARRSRVAGGRGPGRRRRRGVGR